MVWLFGRRRQRLTQLAFILGFINSMYCIKKTESDMISTYRNAVSEKVKATNMEDVLEIDGSTNGFINTRGNNHT